MHIAHVKSSQELLPKYTEQERQLTCPEGVCVQAVFQQPELRGMSARARPRVTLRMVLVLFAELLFFALDLKNSAPALAKGPARASSYDQLGLSQRRGVREDTQRCCMMERRLQRKSRGNGATRGIGG